MKENITEKHDSYGLVGFSRISCTKGLSLFGSSIRHPNVISLRIMRANKTRQYNRDYHSSEEQLIEVYMSQAQFAECITSMNMGDGVPCTIMRVAGKEMPPCKEVSERLKLQEDFESQVKEVNTSVREMLETVNNLTHKMTKKDQETIKKATEKIVREMEENLPFVRESYEKSIDKSIKEGKAEIEAFALNRQLNGMVDNQSLEGRKVEILTEGEL